MPNDKESHPREFRSLADLQSIYFPELKDEAQRSLSAPRQVGARLARQVLSEVLRVPPPTSKPGEAVAKPRTKRKS